MNAPSHLVLLVHADPSVRLRYVEACRASGILADVVALVADPVPGLPGGGLSARYDALAAGARQIGRGSAVRGLVSRYRPPRGLEEYEHVILATFSAGYGFARGLTDVDRAMLSGLVLIDSGHGPEGLGGASLDWLMPWARAGREGRKVLAIGHTDVDPVSYASTTEVAEAAIARSGGPLADLGVGEAWGDDPGLRRRRRLNALTVEGYDLRPRGEAKAEHGDALTVWGDELVARACCVALGIVSGSPLPSFSIGEPAPLAPWVGPSHGYRCSVAELYRDGVALGSWVPIADVLAGRYVVQAGDLVLSARAGGDPTLGGPGHVERAAEDAGGPGYGWSAVDTIGGNEGNRWVRARLDLTGPDVRGIIRVDPAIGARAVKLAIEQLEAGVAELPGAKHHPAIQAYHAGARRGGSPLAGMPGHESEGVSVLGARAADEQPWCSSSASWCGYQAAAVSADR